MAFLFVKYVTRDMNHHAGCDDAQVSLLFFSFLPIPFEVSSCL